VFSANDVTLARKVEKVIRREFAVEIRRKEEEIELINDVSFVFMHLFLNTLKQCDCRFDLVSCFSCRCIFLS
jgi:hypothetical protein